MYACPLLQTAQIYIHTIIMCLWVPITSSTTLYCWSLHSMYSINICLFVYFIIADRIPLVANQKCQRLHDDADSNSATQPWSLRCCLVHGGLLEALCKQTLMPHSGNTTQFWYHHGQIVAPTLWHTVVTWHSVVTWHTLANC